MKEQITPIKTYWTACKDCRGRGKKRRKLTKKVKLRYQYELERFENSDRSGVAPERPRGHLSICMSCDGSGLQQTDHPPIADTEHYPHVAIIGGGIGGMALAVACYHRSIPFTLYERDNDFEARSQGYGLTLQQASKAMKGLGVFLGNSGVVSIRHLVHATDGRVLGQWGGGIPAPRAEGTSVRRSNIHIARQSLRSSILEQLGEDNVIRWGYQLIDIHETEDQRLEMSFSVNGTIRRASADLLVGADGIRSTVRRLSIGEGSSPLRYLDCMVILGICPLVELEKLESPLLDSETVFQTANGKERLYVMPYTADSVMWQFSFPISESEAQQLSRLGSHALKEEACRRTYWHSPIPELMAATPVAKVSGYPVYDRRQLTPSDFTSVGNMTVLGDAAHPMSPFKGQGANQALLDALSLARIIAQECPFVDWKKMGLRDTVLKDFEKEMLIRSASKVQGSADAAQFLHSDIVLDESNQPRGKCRLG
ncbi:FAD-dependent oxidoreductase [Sphingobacterium faecale]|uniref:FAD-dependent oxidoreductase n=1 Tax=Sphingobacterium faecale TaxID=2803775 RepID=UPI001F27DEF2|nr:NAD(P)/FAD-dependent oxidoreductase [Sphingobacterium faecale]